MTLWLDDVREPWKHGHVGADWVKTADAAIAALKTGKYTFASLDHDLTEAQSRGQRTPRDRTGLTVVQWLAKNPQFWPKHGVKVHSMYPKGSRLMRDIIHAHYGRRFDSLELIERQAAMEKAGW